MKILLTGAYAYSKKQIEDIINIGFEVDFIQYESDKIDCTQYDGIVCNGLFLHHDISKFTNLKFIQLTSAGFDRVPMDYVIQNGIRINNAAGVYNIPIAEYTILKILEFYKKSREFYRKQENCEWTKERDIIELNGKKTAIVGYGNIGKEIAKRLHGFGVLITGVDINDISCAYLSKREHIDNIDRVLKESDIVILTLPLNENTKGLISRKSFELMKKSCLLVNVSRGQIVNQKELISALKEGKIAGAILDVFEEEPLNENDELWNMNNVIITPHNSFVGEGNAVRMFDVIYKNLKEWKSKI